MASIHAHIFLKEMLNTRLVPQISYFSIFHSQLFYVPLHPLKKKDLSA